MKQKTNRTYLYIGIVVILLVIHGVMTANGNKKEKESEPKSNIGEYVYIDSQGILHTEQCYIGLEVTNGEGESYLKPVTRVKTIEVLPDYLRRTCSFCVKDEDYERLMEIAEGNRR
jgi:hypothetical protein